MNRKLKYNLILLLNIIVICFLFFSISNNQPYIKNVNDDDVGIFLWTEDIVYLNLTTPENKSYAEPMSGYYPATFGFEGDANGSNPEEWLVDDDGGIVQVIPSHYKHKKIVELHELTDNFTGISNIFGNRTTGALECWVMVNREDDWFSFGVYDGVTIDGIHIGFADDGKIKYYNGSWRTITTYSVNTWYHFRIGWDCATDWHLWINGTSQDGGAGYYFLNSPSTVDRAQFQISNAGGHNDQYMHVDAVGYLWDVNYAIGENLKEGLLISYETNTELDWKAFSLDNAQNISVNGNHTIPFPEEGLHNIQLFGNDSSGKNYESDLVYFSIDASPPAITINLPGDNEFFGASAPSFALTIKELNINKTWYTLDNGNINITFIGLSGTINQTEWAKIGSESVNVRFYANDSFGFESYSEVMINKDIDPPSSIILFTRHSGTNIVNHSTTFTVIPNDGSGSGVSLVRYKINDSSWITYTSPFSLSAYSAGYYLISFYSIDEVGNEELELSILVKLVDTSSSTIPGYNVVLTVGIICAFTLVFLRRKYKFR